jgi:hypothetical protein
VTVSGGLIFALIVATELIVLFRLALPDFLAWAEARHQEVYGVSDGDCFQASLLNSTHAQPDTETGVQQHGAR